MRTSCRGKQLHAERFLHSNLKKFTSNNYCSNIVLSFLCLASHVNAPEYVPGGAVAATGPRQSIQNQAPAAASARSHGHGDGASGE